MVELLVNFPLREASPLQSEPNPPVDVVRLAEPEAGQQILDPHTLCCPQLCPCCVCSRVGAKVTQQFVLLE